VIAAPTWNDVLPTVVLEAMATGRPVLGTAVGGIPYLLGASEGSALSGGPAMPGEGGRTPAGGGTGAGGEGGATAAMWEAAAGWAVAPEPAALAAALPVARAEAGRLGKAARDRYLRHFHPDVLTARLIDIYSEITANSNHSPS
jgi:glycosyltransferase involved in cell wall biosynthesis